MTAEQQKRLDDALAAYNHALNIQQTRFSEYNHWKVLGDNCQAARDKYSFGPKKNEACHIDNLTMYNKNRDAAQNQYLAAVENANLAKANYEKIKAEIYSASQQALETDVNLQQTQQQTQSAENINQQNIANQQAINAQNLANQKAQSEARNKVIMYIAGGTLLVSVIIIVIIRITR